MSLPLATFLDPEPFTAALVQAVIILLVIRLLDLWEREPLWVLLAMALWGAVGATAIAAPLNQALIGSFSPDVSLVWGPAIAAPLVEEIAKGLALVAAFLGSRWLSRRYGIAEFNGPTDGMVYGAAVGLGFAFAENNMYFLNEAYKASSIKAGLEVLSLREGFLNLNTLGHAVYTGSFGAGVGLATWSRTAGGRIGFPLLGLAVGIVLHAVNNGLIQFLLVARFGLERTADMLRGESVPADVAAQANAVAQAGKVAHDVFDYGVAAAFVLALLLWSLYQRRVLNYELAEEANQGLIHADEYRALARLGGRLTWYARLLGSGRLAEARTVRRSHERLAELAFLKWRARRTGSDSAPVDRLRREIRLSREADARLAAGSA